MDFASSGGLVLLCSGGWNIRRLRLDEYSQAISVGMRSTTSGLSRALLSVVFFVAFFLFWLLTALAAKMKTHLRSSLGACLRSSCLAVPRLLRSRPIGAPSPSQIRPSPSPDPSHIVSSVRSMSTNTNTMPTSLVIPIASAWQQGAFLPGANLSAASEASGVPAHPLDATAPTPPPQLLQLVSVREPAQFRNPV
ncbi:hypothetical protein OG21DRAFT_1516600 [Imleria badia]|nr:hypothetical protein OG21DRAFT_1516600 [Imleria badia]